MAAGQILDRVPTGVFEGGATAVFAIRGTTLYANRRQVAELAPGTRLPLACSSPRATTITLVEDALLTQRVGHGGDARVVAAQWGQQVSATLGKAEPKGSGWMPRGCDRRGPIGRLLTILAETVGDSPPPAS